MSLIKLPDVIYSIVTNFLPAAGALTSNISNATKKAFRKNSDQAFTIAARRYRFNITDPDNITQQFQVQYELLKKTNQVLLEKFPFLSSNCQEKDPLQLQWKISETLQKCTPNNANLHRSVQFFLDKFKGNDIPCTKAFCLLLINYPHIKLSNTVWKELMEKHPDFAVAYFSRLQNNEQQSGFSTFVFELKVNCVQALIKNGYTPSEFEIRCAVMNTRFATNKRKEVAKQILTTIFNSSGKKKAINEMIRAMKAMSNEQFDKEYPILAWKSSKNIDASL